MDSRNEILKQIRDGVIVGVPVDAQVELVALSLDAIQGPTTTDTPVTINYGAAQPGSVISLAADGVYTFHETGTFNFNIYLQYGRTGAAGTSHLLFRSMLDPNTGTYQPAGTTIPQYIANASDLKVLILTLPVAITVPETKLKQELIRDSSGNDSGDLVSHTPADPQFGICPCSQLIIWRNKT